MVRSVSPVFRTAIRFMPSCPLYTAPTTSNPSRFSCSTRTVLERHLGGKVVLTKVRVFALHLVSTAQIACPGRPALDTSLFRGVPVSLAWSLPLSGSALICLINPVSSVPIFRVVFPPSNSTAVFFSIPNLPSSETPRFS